MDTIKNLLYAITFFHFCRFIGVNLCTLAHWFKVVMSFFSYVLFLPVYLRFSYLNYKKKKYVKKYMKRYETKTS